MKYAIRLVVANLYLCIDGAIDYYVSDPSKAADFETPRGASQFIIAHHLDHTTHVVEEIEGDQK